MHPARSIIGTVCCLALALRFTEAVFMINTNPAVVEFGVANAALPLCFDKTIYALSRSPESVSFISPTNINYVKVETLTPGLYGGVTAEITSGAVLGPNVVVKLTENGRKLLFKSNIRVTMFCMAP